MKTAFLILASICLTISASYGQTKDFFIGPSLSFHNETRSKMIYGPGLEERNSFSQFAGLGIRMQKKLNESWGVNIGLNYVKRQYEMRVPYNHCYYISPEEFCTSILAHVDKYGYKTLEVPIGINKYLITSDRLELYLNLTPLVALDFQSFYNSYIPSSGVKRNNEINLFSGSLLSGFGFAYNLTDKLKLNFEPFLRLIHTQRLDPILITGYENRWSHFDNYGGHLILMYRL